jgi:transposase-like protein
MDEALGASKSERVDTRLGYRSRYYPRALTTRVGKIELRVPRDRQGRFSTEIFNRYQRSEKALVLAIAEMYVQGVSTRDVSEIAEELFGDSISASSVSRLNKSLDQIVNSFANRKLECEYPYLILDARYEKVRENGVVS